MNKVQLLKEIEEDFNKLLSKNRQKKVDDQKENKTKTKASSTTTKTTKDKTKTRSTKKTK